MSYTPGTLGLREDLYDVTLTVPGQGTFEIDKLTGGGAKSKDAKYRPANGTERQLSLGGPKEIDNAVCDALYNNQTMNIHALIEAAGKTTVTVARTPIDENGNANAALTVTYKGKLIDVTPPPVDSESEKAAVVQFTVSLESALT